VVHPEAVLDPQIYGVNHRSESVSNGVVKGGAGDHRETAAEVAGMTVKNPLGPHDSSGAPEPKKS
jgi:hypothetical protein